MRTTLNSPPRDPLCEQALATNKALRRENDALWRELRELRREMREQRQLVAQADASSGLQDALLAAASETVRAYRDSPWTYLPWKGYVS